MSTSYRARALALILIVLSFGLAHAQQPTAPLSVSLSCRIEESDAAKTVDTFVATLSDARRWSLFSTKGANILGAHLRQYERVGKSSAWVCAVEISNGATYPDGSGAASSAVIYQSIEIAVPIGWTIVPEMPRGTSTGRTWTLCTGAGHYFPQCSRAIRRFVVYRNDQPQRAIDAARKRMLLEDLVIPAVVTNYGEHASKLPRVDRVKMEAQFHGQVVALRDALAKGQANEAVGLYSKALGIHQPFRSKLAYDYGGGGIELATGWEQCPSGVLLRRMQMDLEIERCCIAYYDKTTGNRITYADIANAPWMPLVGDEEAENALPRQFFGLHDFNPGPSPDKQPMLEFDTYDGAHSVRETAPARPPALLAHDPVAIVELVSRAEWDALSYNPKGFLHNLLVAAQAKPQTASANLGRDYGHVMATAATAILLQPTPARRAYGQMLLDVYDMSAMPNGVTQRESFGETFGGLDAVWGPAINAPKTAQIAQALECSKVINGAFALRRQLVGKWTGREPELRACRQLYRGRLPLGTYTYGGIGIPHYIDVGSKAHGPALPLSMGYGDFDPVDILHVMALAERVDRARMNVKDAGWIDASLYFNSPATSRAQRLAQLEAWGANDQTCEMLSLMQP